MNYHQDVDKGGRTLDLDVREIERLSAAQLEVLFRWLGGGAIADDASHTANQHGDAHCDYTSHSDHSDHCDHADTGVTGGRHADHSDAHSDVHFDSSGPVRPGLPAGTLNPAFLKLRGLEPAMLGNYKQEELHLLFHELGLRGEAEARMGFAGHVLLEGRPNHDDWHNDMAEKHTDNAHKEHSDFAYHSDHNDTHTDFHLDSNGTHGDHGDLASPHLDTSGQHLDTGQHSDLHFDHTDANKNDHWDDKPHMDHSDAHQDYHCDDHMDHWDHTDVSSKPSFVDA